MMDERSDSERIADLVRVLAKVAAGDYSEKPELEDAQDEIARFTLATRFMIDDLEASRAIEAERREALERANAQLRELDDVKTRFINSAAHELNTPLTPIGMQLHLLRSGKLGALSDPQRNAVEMLSRNLDRLSFLVTDLLDAARLQSDQLRLERRDAHIDELARECVQSFLPQARGAGVRLACVAPPSVQANVDPRRITQVLFNLVSNALKFTPEGGTIEVEVDPEPRAIVLRVRDSGPGLTRAQIDRLFLPFSQVHDPMTLSRGGTGLGLYISRGIVEQHGGSMWVESEGAGRGATFVMALPKG